MDSKTFDDIHDYIIKSKNEQALKDFYSKWRLIKLNLRSVTSAARARIEH